MKILIGEEAKQKRNLYIEKFINSDSSYYRERIQTLIPCSDGLCYRGYLWDCYNSLQLVSEEECEEYLKKVSKFFVMWDVNSKDYIFIPDYWKYPKTAVLSVSLEEYKQIAETLPEDIYLFDESFTWSFALTHEEGSDDNRYCCFTHSELQYEYFLDKRVYTKEELE